MEVREVVPAERAWVEDVLVRRWGSTDIAGRCGTHNAAELPGLVAEIEGERVGLLTYHETDRELELVTIDALRSSIGVGTALLQGVRQLAVAHQCHRVWLVTSNDNLGALRFYQRRGFRLVAVHVGGVDAARVHKASIPTVGLDGIPVHDEIELEWQRPPPTSGSTDTEAGTSEGNRVLEPAGEVEHTIPDRLGR
jgi:GNAT superfamily N-acetyltransferase